MKIHTTSEVRANLYKMVDSVSETHEPIYIKGRRHEAVLLSKEDFDNMQETLFLLSIPGMRESLRDGMAEKPDECSDKLDW